MTARLLIAVRSVHLVARGMTVLLVCSQVLVAQWINLADQTSSRLIAAPAVGSADLQEKDYAWGDVDLDGDIDLVCVRKASWTTTGRFTNVLFLNELGVLTDRTTPFASASTVSGSSGFLDLTNSWNDVLIADVDEDIPGCARRMHIYRNLGNSPTVTLMEEQLGGRVAGISTGQLAGTHDMAVFDIDGDGWKDVVVGRCTGTEVYINQPPVGVIFHPGPSPS